MVPFSFSRARSASVLVSKVTNPKPCEQRRKGERKRQRETERGCGDREREGGESGELAQEMRLPQCRDGEPGPDPPLGLGVLAEAPASPASWEKSLGEGHRKQGRYNRDIHTQRDKSCLCREGQSEPSPPSGARGAGTHTAPSVSTEQWDGAAPRWGTPCLGPVGQERRGERAEELPAIPALPGPLPRACHNGAGRRQHPPWSPAH